jgi:CelD/BcsL family acetyltransferase involved in cellulose biosynthesis
MASLRVGPEIAAGEICLVGAGTLHSWIAAYDPRFSNVAPGIQLIGALLVGAPDLGVARVDFGTGHADYKLLFAEPQGRYLEGAACADGAAGAARRLTLNLWRAAETAPLGPVSRFAGKLRRRSAQIAAVETGLPGRARGVLSALTSFAPHPA